VATIGRISLPNIVTNSGVAACQTAGPLYEQGVAYTLGKLHHCPMCTPTSTWATRAGWAGLEFGGRAAAEFAKC